MLSSEYYFHFSSEELQLIYDESFRRKKTTLNQTFIPGSTESDDL